MKGVLYCMSPKAAAITYREYLLGQSSEEQQQTVELSLLSDNEAYDLMVSAEIDLIEDSIDGKLTAQDEHRFWTYFLVAPERQRKLEFAKAFRDFLNRRPREEAPSIWDYTIAFFRRPAFAAAAAALLAVAMVDGAWTVGLHHRLNSATTQLHQVEHQLENLTVQLSESRAERKRMSVQFVRFEKVITDFESSAATAAIMTLNLVPSIRTRGSTDSMPVATLPEKGLWIRFSLTLPETSDSTFRVVLVDDAGAEIWQDDRVTAANGSQGAVVLLTVRADNLIEGDYNLKLISVAKLDAPETLANYYFHVAHAAAKR